MYAEIRTILVFYRIKHKLSQKILGEILGVSQSQVSKWESGAHKPNKLRELDIRKRLL